MINNTILRKFQVFEVFGYSVSKISGFIRIRILKFPSIRPCPNRHPYSGVQTQLREMSREESMTPPTTYATVTAPPHKATVRPKMVKKDQMIMGRSRQEQRVASKEPPASTCVDPEEEDDVLIINCDPEDYFPDDDEDYAQAEIPQESKAEASKLVTAQAKIVEREAAYYQDMKEVASDLAKHPPPSTANLATPPNKNAPPSENEGIRVLVGPTHNICTESK